MTSLLSACYYLHSSSTQRLGTDQGPLVLHTLHTQSPCSFLKGLLLTTHTLHHGEVTCPKPPSQQPDPKFDSWAVRAVSSKLLLQTLLPHIGSLQPPRQILSLFFPNSWDFGQICHHELLPMSEEQPNLVRLVQTLSAGEV